MDETQGWGRKLLPCPQQCWLKAPKAPRHLALPTSTATQGQPSREGLGTAATAPSPLPPPSLAPWPARDKGAGSSTALTCQCKKQGTVTLAPCLIWGRGTSRAGGSVFWVRTLFKLHTTTACPVGHHPPVHRHPFQERE